MRIGVDGRRDERLDPGDELFLHLRQADARTLEPEVGFARRPRPVRLRSGLRRQPEDRRAGRYSFRYSRSRRVCVRLTGISVDFSSFILRM